MTQRARSTGATRVRSHVRLVTAALVSACVAPAAFGGVSAFTDRAGPSRTDRRPEGPPAVLVERPVCSGDGDATDVRRRGAVRTRVDGSPGPALAVGVPSTALVRLDRSGRVVAAWTNTGCAPRSGDEVFVQRPDGSIVPGTTSSIRHHRWTGDFTEPGVFVAQPRSMD